LPRPFAWHSGFAASAAPFSCWEERSLSGEVFAFARMQRTTFDSALLVAPQLRQFLAEHPGEYRILNLWNPNTTMSLRAFDAWGYDPGVTRRYAEFIDWSEGGDPDRATNYVTFRRFHPLLAMLRVKYVVVVENSVMTIHPGAVPPLRRLAADTQGRARIVREGTDFMEVDADAWATWIVAAVLLWRRVRRLARA